MGQLPMHRISQFMCLMVILMITSCADSPSNRLRGIYDISLLDKQQPSDADEIEELEDEQNEPTTFSEMNPQNTVTMAKEKPANVLDTYPFLRGMPFYCDPVRYSMSIIFNTAGCEPFLQYLFGGVGNTYGNQILRTLDPVPLHIGDAGLLGDFPAIYGGYTEDFFTRTQDKDGCYRPYSRYRSFRNDLCL